MFVATIAAVWRRTKLARMARVLLPLLPIGRFVFGKCRDKRWLRRERKCSRRLAIAGLAHVSIPSMASLVKAITSIDQDLALC